ncbi:MAG: hypothetical protein LBD99_03675, partial [Candidatus Margulisbacteria bacterium]|nr:hypothetical protein [Candidatus Margulisiibacteriota bacterium]
AYINIVCTKYPRGMHKVCISLERLTRLRAAGAQEEEKQQKLAEKRRAEIRLNPGLQTRRLRAKPLKLLRDYHILELVEKENI